MKKTILSLIPVLLLAATGSPTPPVLTDAQKAEIYRALYEAESLRAARDAIAKADKDLQAAMQACGEGWAVARDDNRNLVCIAAPKPPAAPQGANYVPPAKPEAQKGK